MKKITLLLLLFVFSGGLNAQKLVILSTTDLHSKLTGFGPENAYTPLSVNDDETLGGFARIAAIINEEKEKNPNAVLTLDAGDFLMGTIFHADEAKTGFQLQLMKDMGYDVLTIGNHEFDYGPEVLSQIIQTADKKGDIPYLVASQMKFPEDNPKTDGLKMLYLDGTIRHSLILERQGLKIGIFGLIGEDAVSVAPDAKPVSFTDAAETAAQMTEILRKVGNVDIVICLSHSGLMKDEDNGYTGEDIDLAEKVPGIDIIISGHTHLLTPEIEYAGKTAIIQPGSYGTHIGRLELNYSNSEITDLDFKLIQVDDKIVDDPQVHQAVEDYKKHVAERFFKPFGLEYAKPVAKTQFDLLRSTHVNNTHGNLGDFTADAIKYYTDKYAQKTDVAIIANGTIREHILAGEITPADVFRVLPLGYGNDDIPGNSLAMIYITPRELKKLAEVIIMSNSPGTDSYLYVSGMEVFYKPKKMMLRKVQSIKLNGEELDISKSNKNLVSITADTYLLKFVSRIKQMSKGLVKIVPKDKNGEPVEDIYRQVLDFDKNKAGLQEGKQWLAVIEYLKSFGSGNGLPVVPEKYEEELTRFHPIKK
jgi:5'-nucleotidase